MMVSFEFWYLYNIRETVLLPPIL